MVIAVTALAAWRPRARTPPGDRAIVAAGIATAAMLARVPWARPLPALPAVVLHVTLVVRLLAPAPRAASGSAPRAEALP